MKILISKLEKKQEISKIDTDNYKNVLNEKDLDNLIRKLDEKSIISVDTETSSLDPIEADLIGVSYRT